MNSSSFPIGRPYIVNYGGEFVFNLDYASETELTLTGMVGRYKGLKETVKIQVTPIRPSVYMVSWQELSRNTVVHIEDFENETSYAFLTLPEMTFVRMKGSLKRAD